MKMRFNTQVAKPYIKAAVTAAYGPIAGILVSFAIDYGMELMQKYLDGAMKYYAAGGKGSYLKWLIDPSGYVFDLTTGERLEGVKVTAYCILYDDSSGFWDKPDTSKMIEWDASEYSQINPLITNSEGFYSWDVPEGWWQVKYELNGYETVYSDWLMVPPPQMDVNIGMKKSSSSQFIIGDVNDDGKVNMKDYAKLQQYLNDSTIAINELAADLNGDSKINMKDYALLLRKLNGWEV